MARILTGLQPSGALHIGNYFGALKPFVEFSKEYESFLMIADYHALTSLKDAADLRGNIIEVARAYLAAGIDPEESVIFKQSDVPEHMELSWIFQCLVTVPFLQQAHSYKDKVAKGLEPNAGLFAYPMLMAADILLYDTDVVPVGQDQTQHVEYAREAANKFNNTYGELFKMPQEKVVSGVGVVPGTDGKKMSKSYGNTIPLFASRDEVAKAVMSIITDSSGDKPENVYAIHKLFRHGEELEQLYADNVGKYKNLKDALIEDMDSALSHMRERHDAITDEEVKQILKHGGEKAHAVASQKMAAVREIVGVAI